MSAPKFPEAPGAWESRAFFAAMLAACKGDDKKAGDILREIAESMSKDVMKKGVEHGGGREAGG